MVGSWGSKLLQEREKNGIPFQLFHEMGFITNEAPEKSNEIFFLRQKHL